MPGGSAFSFPSPQGKGERRSRLAEASTRGEGASMRITDIEVIELRVPGWEGLTFDGSYDDCVVLVHTDEGVSGLAEVDSVPAVVRAIVEAPRSHTHAMGLKSVLVGADPEDVEGLWEKMYDATSYYG